ncbi:MAG: hypothetical protein LBL17_00335 [Coxiellaceae bacterium]|jgi:uncharacterized coiled-coil DUF342 family protein|nr:hypothetical protein [Coxiellaceae bacterium]
MMEELTDKLSNCCNIVVANLNHLSEKLGKIIEAKRKMVNNSGESNILQQGSSIANLEVIQAKLPLSIDKTKQLCQEIQKLLVAVVV